MPGNTELWSPPVPVSSASQKTSFAYESTVKRWPTILTTVIDELARLNGTLLDEKDAEKLKESKAIIQAIAQLIYEMRHDRELSPIPDDNAFPSDTKLYNDELTRLSQVGENKWFTTPWLYGECYMYRRLRSLFASTTHWNEFDPFFDQKQSAFRSSFVGVATLAKSLNEVVGRGGGRRLGIDDPELKSEWIKMLEVCLWGNATDLSLLTSLTHEDIQALQSVERGASFVLKNDFEACWNKFKMLKPGSRVDIVLDNSGFELFSDLVLADWLVTVSPFCSNVVFHPKLIPWFVSDVLPFDFRAIIDSLSDPSFFPPSDDKEGLDAISILVERWKGYINDGTFRLSVPSDVPLGKGTSSSAAFWTSPFSFANMAKQAPDLLSELKQSSLVIFKGDLNYRKLTSDGCWPTTTPFEDAIGPLRGEIELLSLRTCKADVCVGLQEGKMEELDSDDPTWRVSGKYAVVSYVGKKE